MFNLSLTDEQLKEIVTGAVFGAIDPAKRDEMVQQGIRALLLPPNDDKYKKTTLLQDAFAWSLEKVCREATTAAVNTPEVKVKVQALVTDAIMKLMAEDDRTKTVDLITTALLNSFKSDYR